MQINFEYISGEGILTFKDAFRFSLTSFSNNVVLIQGDNKDEPLAISNGSGKSNILETLTFTLFGKLSKGVKYLNDIINLESEMAKGEVGFTVGEDFYRVVRTRNRAKITTLNIFRNGSDKPELVDADNTTKQDYLENLIGLDFLTYSHTIMFCQRFVAFPDLKAPQRASLLSEISGANAYLKAAKLSKERADSVATTMSEIATEKRQVQQLLDEITSVDYDSQIAQFNQEKKTNLKRLCKEAAERKIYLLQYRKGEQQSIDKCKAEIQSYEKRIKSLKKYLDNNKEVKTKVSQAERQAFVADNASRSLRQKLQAKQKEIQRAEQTKAGTCPYCSQELSLETIEAHISTLRMEESILKREVSVAQTFSNGENEVYSNLKEQAEEYRKKQRTFRDLETSLTSAQLNLKTFQSTRVEDEVNQAIQSKLAAIKRELGNNY